MRILYCDLRPKWTVAGHRNFDMKWAKYLSKVAEVTLFCPDDAWYDHVGHGIHKEIYDAGSIVESKGWVNWRIWHNGNFKRFAVKDHYEAILYIKKVIHLTKNNHYDYIFIGALDLLSYSLYRNKLKKVSKLVLLNHSVYYESGLLESLYRKCKDDFIHIVMEQDGVEYLVGHYGIDRRKAHYIPHMLNPVDLKKMADVEPFEMVGISNSNVDEEIEKIISLDRSEGFFEKNGIRGIIRSKNIIYQSDYLKVFTGRLGLTFEEYYSYILKAKIIVLPFSERFGLRSSGTIQDAFSQNIPILGNPFATMLQYERKYPNICKTYSNMEEFKDKMIEVLNRKEAYKKEYKGFQEEHSDQVILERIREIFV